MSSLPAQNGASDHSGGTQERNQIDNITSEACPSHTVAPVESEAPSTQAETTEQIAENSADTNIKAVKEPETVEQSEQTDTVTEEPTPLAHGLLENATADETSTLPTKQSIATANAPASLENTAIATDPGYSLRNRRLPHYLRRIQNAWRSRRTHSDHRMVSLSLLILLLAGSIVPLLITATYGIKAYQTYSELRAHANSGYQHLIAVKAIFMDAKSHPISLLDTNKLVQARQNFIIAHSELVETQTLLDQSDFIHAITNYLPSYQTQIVSTRAACQIGIDIADIGQQATDVAIILTPRLHSPLLSISKAPLITQIDLTLIDTTIDHIQSLISDIEAQSQRLSLDALPINAHQREQVRQILPWLPQVQRDLTLGHSLLSSANWLLGVNQPRTFLVQTLDRSELRATGGFTGQYGVLKINEGRIAPFSLHDIALVEYANNNPTTGNLAPPAYRTWWPFANWGLRDANLSADFPTTAQLTIEQYKSEMHQQVDGAISFTPFLVQHILTVTGPISIPRYHETITTQNLEDRLHYYQLDNRGIRKEEIVEKVPDSPSAPDQARKLFTARLAHVFIDHIRQAPPQELLAIGKQLLTDLQTRDLQIYVSNPQIESLLQQHDYAGQIDRSTTHDGFYIVQMNLSASKASQYVQTNVSDTVSLDATGGALHQLQMRLIYNQRGPVYGLDTYRDYIRVYVPPRAKFRGGDGFDTGQPRCGGVLGACPANGIYQHNELACSPGQYDAGAAAPMLNDPYQGEYHPLDTIGPPTNFKSDESERAMFGGWVVIPKNCTMTVSLSWYTPAMGTTPYTLLVQRQAGLFPQIHLEVQPVAGVCSNITAPLTFNGELDEDTSFALKIRRPSVIRDNTVSCTLQTAAS